jgi:hypothetical protein
VTVVCISLGRFWGVEFVRVADAFVGLQFKIGSAEGVALAGGEIGERHLVSSRGESEGYFDRAIRNCSPSDVRECIPLPSRHAAGAWLGLMLGRVLSARTYTHLKCGSRAGNKSQGVAEPAP